MTWFRGSVDIEDVHPLGGGSGRMKFRRDRRPELPVEPFWRFYPRYVFGSAVKFARWIVLFLRIRGLYQAIKRSPGSRRYSDLAISPVVEDEFATRDLFRSEAAQAY